MTATNQFLGTPEYMAPEQWGSSKDIDVRAVIYSLGCTLYCLLSGRAPFEDEDHRSVGSKLKGHLHDQPPCISHYGPALPNELITTVNKMLAKSPDDRFQSPTELLTALRPLCVGTNLQALVLQLKPEPLDIGKLMDSQKTHLPETQVRDSPIDTPNDSNTTEKDGNATVNKGTVSFATKSHGNIEAKRVSK